MELALDRLCGIGIGRLKNGFYFFRQDVAFLWRKGFFMSRGDSRINFLEGNIIKQIIVFSIPIILGELFQNLYQSVDSVVVGNFVGKTALAAVAVCETPTNLLVGFFNGMSLGSTVVVANAFGSGQRDRLSSSMRVTFSISVLLGVLMSILGVICAPWLLKITSVDAAIYGEAISYMRIYLFGIMFTIIYNIGSGILRALGDSSTPFRILAISCFFNIGFDLLFVIVFSLGVVGVALATILSQGISTILVYRALQKKNEEFHLDFVELKKEKKTISDLINIGMPTGLQASLVSISNMFVWRYINSFPTDVVAGIGCAQRLDRFVGMPGKAVGMTMTAFVSQNEGAKNYKRSRLGLWYGLAGSLAVVVIIAFPLYQVADLCVGIFSREADVVSVGVSMMHTIIPLYVFLYVREVFAGVLRGHGETKIPTILSLIGMIGVRQIFLAIAMGYSHRVEWIYYCYPIAWASAAILLFVYLMIRMRTWKKQEIKECP